MPPFTDDVIDERLKRALEATSDARLQRFIEGMNAMSQWRERTTKLLEAEARSDEWLNAHLARVSDVAEAWGKGLQEQADGVRTNNEVWKDLGPKWNAALDDVARASLGALYDRQDVSDGAGISRWVGALNDDPAEKLRSWRGQYSRLGLEYVFGDPPAPPASTTPPQDVGTSRQALDEKPPQLNVCQRAPYTSSNASQSRDGLAIIANRGGVDLRSGNGFIDTMTFAPVLAGGGGSVLVVMGSTVSWPKGYTSIDVTAAITWSASMRAIAVLGGATTSMELVLLVALPDGRQEILTSFLGAATAPLLFFSDVIVPPTTSTLGIFNIALDGSAGDAIVLAGIRGYSAGVGIVGSSAARVQANVRVDSICSLLR